MSCAIECTTALLRTLIVIDVKEPVVYVRIIVPDHLEIAAEERMVADVEANDCRISATLKLVVSSSLDQCQQARTV